MSVTSIYGFEINVYETLSGENDKVAKILELLKTVRNGDDKTVIYTADDETARKISEAITDSKFIENCLLLTRKMTSYEGKFKPSKAMETFECTRGAVIIGGYKTLSYEKQPMADHYLFSDLPNDETTLIRLMKKINPTLIAKKKSARFDMLVSTEKDWTWTIKNLQDIPGIRTELEMYRIPKNDAPSSSKSSSSIEKSMNLNDIKPDANGKYLVPAEWITGYGSDKEFSDNEDKEEEYGEEYYLFD